MTNRSLLSSELFRHVATLATGTALAQLIPVLLQPVLRRLFVPDDFGLFAVYASVFGIAAVLANGGYELAIVNPKQDREAAHLVAVCLLINACYNTVFFALLWWFEPQVLGWLDLPASMGVWLHVLPLTTFLFAAFQAFNYWLIRKKKFRASSINKVSRRAAEGTAQTSLGWVGNTSGLLVGDLIGHTANAIVSAAQALRAGFAPGSLTFSELKSAMRNYRKFPAYSALPTFLNTASLMLPVIMINRFYTETETGQFDLSRMVLALPLALISMAVSQVLLQRLAERRNNGQALWGELRSMSVVLFGGAAAGAAVIWLAGQWLFPTIFGTEWEQAGVLAEVLVLSFAIKFVVSPLTAVFNALEKLVMKAIWQIGYFCAIAALFFFPDWPLERFIEVLITIDVVAYATYFVLVWWAASQHDRQLSA